MGEEGAVVKSSNGREIQAMTLNMKEQRILQKRLQILKLEQSFRVKSLNIDKKQIKVFQKRLCNNVGKIKSYLSAEDIAFMKNLELEGRFKPEYNSVYVSNLMTIMAATKRLKLLTNEEIKQLTEEDFREVGNQLLDDTRSEEPPPKPADDTVDQGKEDEEKTNRPKRFGSSRSRSASRCMRTHPPHPPQQQQLISEDITPLNIRQGSGSRKGSATCRNNRSTSLPPELASNNNKDSRSRPTTAASRNTFTNSPKSSKKLPQLSSNSQMKEDSVDGARPLSRTNSRESDLDEAATMFRPNSSISRVSRPRSRLEQQKQQQQRIPETAREQRPPLARPMTTGGYLTARPRTAKSERRPQTTLGVESKGLNYSSHKTLSLQQPDGKDLGGGRAGRRISVMSASSLGSEMAKEKATELRKGLLVYEQGLSDNIEEKRQVFLSRITKWVDENPAIVQQEKPKYAFIDSSDVDTLRANAKATTIENEGLYKNDADSWKDLKKCRYLRLTDDNIDLSGINTLAKDQVHLFGGFRVDYSLPRRGNNPAPV